MKRDFRFQNISLDADNKTISRKYSTLLNGIQQLRWESQKQPPVLPPGKKKYRALSNAAFFIFCSLTFKVSSLHKPTMKVLLRILAFLPESN
jgi:hypothetical protein